MSEAKWSPGPWRFDRRLEEVVDANAQLVVEIVLPSGSEDLARALADGHLIAASPEMAAVLDIVLRVWEEGTKGKIPFPADEVVRVLAKARGES